MDPFIGRDMIDFDYTTDISARMQVPSRLSLVMPGFPSPGHLPDLMPSSRIIISGSNGFDLLSNPFRMFPPQEFDLPMSGLSLLSPQSPMLGRFNQSNVNHASTPDYPPGSSNKDNSNLSLFHSPDAQTDDDRTLVGQDPLDISIEACETAFSMKIEDRMKELATRLAVLEQALVRQNRRDLCVIIIVGTYILLKCGRYFLGRVLR